MMTRNQSVTARHSAGARISAGLFCLLAVCVFLALQTAVAADNEFPFEAALALSDLDLAHCASFHNGVPAPVSEAVLEKALGLGRAGERLAAWSAGRVEREKFSRRKHLFQYRLAFTRPLETGAILTKYPAVAALKDDAPYPGDPDNPEHWQALESHAGTEAPVYMITLPAGFSTRCLLFTHETEPADAAYSVLSPLRVLRRRLFNLAPLGQVLASREYTEQRRHENGKIYQAVDLLRGRGVWMSSGPDQNNQPPRNIITGENPEWLAVAWADAWDVAALYVHGNLDKVVLQTCRPDSSVPPLLVDNDAWHTVTVKRTAESYHGSWLLPQEKMRSEGLRLLIEAAWSGSPRDKQASGIARVSGFMVLTDLGAKPIPEVPNGDILPPPFAIQHEMPLDGVMTMAVDDPAGNRVRNLVARVRRPAGEQHEPWDLRDERGHYIEPGEYRWKSISHKPLRLRYETTVYPNTSLHHPENTPWFNGVGGSGGWLSDHATPVAGTCTDDMIFFGAHLPESGIGFAACDISGGKLWGIRGFDAWTGASYLAADAGIVFAGSPRGGVDRVWRIDPQTRNEELFFSAGKSDDRSRGMRALAAANGRLYLSVYGHQDWFANAAAVGVVDIERCLPSFRVEAKPRFRGNIKLDARQDFLRLCRLAGTPPGGYALSHIPSTRGTLRNQFVMLTFKKPVRIGSVILPTPSSTYVTRLSVARADAPYPPDPQRKEHWLDFPQQPQPGTWDLAAAPPDTATRAMLITFTKGEGDMFDELMADEPLDKPWQVQFEGLRILRRRYRNIAAAAKIRVNSGSISPGGEWSARRQTALSPEDPGIYMLEWPAAQKLRGLAIKEIDGALTEIDVFTGSGVPELDGDTGWEKVADYRQRRRNHHLGTAAANPDARYLDGMVDFGREISTKAVRLRVVAQWLDNGERGTEGQRTDRGGRELDPTRCRVFGVAALEYLGGEVPVDPLISERLEVRDTGNGSLLAEFAIPAPGPLAVAPDGSLLAVSGRQVLRVNPQTGTYTTLITDLKKPTAIAVDRISNIYVFDAAPEQRLIAVYSPDGRRLRVIGEPGGYQVGPWNPQRFQDVRALVIDKEDKLWAVDANYFPKRISCWKTDGTFLRDYLGPTKYGGDGVLDPGDRRRLFIGPLEFEIDWETGHSRLKNITWPSWGSGESSGIEIPGEVPVHLNGRTYLVTRPQGLDPARNRQLCGVVYLYEKDRLKRVAAMGFADAFAPLKTDKFANLLGNRPLAELQFLWTDRNGDGEVQFDECEFGPRQYALLSQFDRDLGIQAGRYRYEVVRFLDNGAPEYELAEYPLGNAKHVYRFSDGTFQVMRTRPLTWHRADGSVSARYHNHGWGVGPDLTAGAYRTDQVVGQFSPVGKETAAAGDLGEFMVVSTNFGSWNIWTGDGLLAGRIFREGRDPEREPWTMPEHSRGMIMDDVNLQQEQFNGWFCRADDGKYYAVAGHNHASIVEVQGLDEFVRREGRITVTAQDLERARKWEVESARAKHITSGLKLIESPPRRASVIIDGFLDDWSGVAGATIPGRARFRMQYDDEYLYLAWEVNGLGPFLNRGNQWRQLFQTGAAVDLQLGTDAAADPERIRPAAGDMRLLLSRTDADGFMAVLYEAVVPGVPEAERWLVRSPTGECGFDRVRRLDNVHVAAVENRHDDDDGEVSGYVVEARVPLHDIGLRPDTLRPLRCDWGVLATDQGATVVMSRNYWSNQATSTLADAPTEARLHPDLWGWLRFTAVDPGRAPVPPSEKQGALQPAARRLSDDEVESLLED